MGIGAYISAILALNMGWTPWITIPLGGLAAMITAGIIGFSFSRLRTIYFSMASLFLGVMITKLVGVFPKLTGDMTGLMSIPGLNEVTIFSLLQINFAASRIPYYYYFLILSLLTLLILYRVEHSRIGLTLKAVAQSHLAASSIGINERAVRILALAIGCFFAGIAGASYAHYVTFISPSTFGLMPSIYLIVYLIVGGTGNFVGPIVGTTVLYLIPHLMSELKGFAPFVLGGVLILSVFLLPQGMVSLLDRITLWLNKIKLLLNQLKLWSNQAKLHNKSKLPISKINKKEVS
jgi:branched-chain amino acid transport system permease protein